jgi:uncharacterized protein YbbC (DUF1343 family)
MVKGISVRKANASALQVGILEHALKETDYHLGKQLAVTSAVNSVGQLKSGKRKFQVLDKDETPITSIMCLNTSTLEAEADDRPTYRILKDIFTIADLYGQKCTIQKNFVEVCDLKEKPKSKWESLVKRFT